jgi:hypothetical protein
LPSRISKRTTRPIRSLGGILVAAAATALVAGCSGNPTCVFTTGCVGGGGPGQGAPAALPDAGVWIVDGAPTVETVLPAAFGVASTTPVVVVFSESVAPESVLGGAIELLPVDLAGFPLGPIPVTEQLVADGRMLLLIPQAALVPSDYVVQIASGAQITDYTGQLLNAAAGAELQSFSVDTVDPVDPALVTLWPPAGTSRQNTQTEIVAVFDRAIDATTVTDAAFDVLVDGVPPTDDPAAQPLSLTVGGFPIQDTRVFTWRSVDVMGDFTSLGASATVDVTLSAAGAEILDLSAGTVPTATSGFTTAAVDPPADSVILSDPTDAIGIASLTPGPTELALQVDLVDGQPGDVLDVYLVGTSLDETDPQLIALSRSISLTGAAPITVVPVTLSDVDLTSDGSPRFADGFVSFAWRLRRGNDVSVVQVLDVDPDEDGIQDPLLDTVAPTIDELLVPGAGSTTSYLTDVRDITVVGRASEALASVEVTTDVGDNGKQPRVMGVDADELFVAAPVPAGMLGPGTVNYTVVGYDGAGNASLPVTGTLEQLGAVGPAVLVPGATIDVDVYDAQTLLPIAGALVVTHSDMGDGLNYPQVASGSTDSGGDVTLASAGAPAIGTILTVDAAGYDLFTFHDLRAARVSIPLHPIDAGGVTSVTGSVTSSSSQADLALPVSQLKLADSRRPTFADPTYPGQACVAGPFGSGGLTCPYGPESIRPDRLGAQSFLAGNMLLTEAGFNAILFLTAFDLHVPVPPVALGGLDTTAVDVPYLLAEATAPVTALPVELPPTVLFGAFTTGIDLGNLDDDVATTGAPRVTVETLVPGVPGPVPVGLGLAFDQGGSIWNVRSAIPGEVTAAGEFGLDPPIVDTDPFLRMELRDADGNVAGQRPRVSELPGLPVPNVLFPANVPGLVTPPAGGSSGGTSFDVVFTNAIQDAQAQEGLYRVVLTDGAGRAWRLWRPDLLDAVGDMLVHVPDLSGAGGSTLLNGTVSVTLSTWSWGGLDPTAFLWTDVEREHDYFSHAAPLTFSQP